MFKKNTAVTGFWIGNFIAVANGNTVTTGTPTCKRTLDGTAGACANAAAYDATGLGWKIDLTADDMAGDMVGLSFTLAGCLPISYTIHTTLLAAEVWDEMIIEHDIEGSAGLMLTQWEKKAGDIWADTDELQTAWADGGRLDSLLDAAAGGLDAAGVRAAVGLASANLDAQLADIPTNDELATALAGADDATLAAIANLGAGAGMGTYSDMITDGTHPLDNVRVYLSTDAEGRNRVYEAYTNANGIFTLYPDPGTYYLWFDLAGYTFDQGNEVEVVAP